MPADNTEESVANFEQTDPPRDIRVEKETHDLYRALAEESDSPFEGSRYLDIFLTAAALGRYEGLRQPLEGETVDLFNVNSLSRRHTTIIRGIAWADTRDDEIYYDQKRAFEIAMEYANGGIRRLHDQHLGIGDTVSQTVADYLKRWQTIQDDIEQRSLSSPGEE